MPNFLSHPYLQQCLLWLRELCLEISLGLALMLIVAMQLHWWLEAPLFQAFFIQPLKVSSFVLVLALGSSLLITHEFADENIKSKHLRSATWFCNSLVFILLVANLVLIAWANTQINNLVLSWVAMFITLVASGVMYFANANRNEVEAQVIISSHVLYQVTQSVTLGSCVLLNLWAHNSDMQFYLFAYLKVFIIIYLIAASCMVIAWVSCKLWKPNGLKQIQQNSAKSAQQAGSILFNMDISNVQRKLLELLALWFSFISPVVMLVGYLWFVQDSLLISISLVSLLTGLSLHHWVLANQRMHATQLQWIRRA